MSHSPQTITAWLSFLKELSGISNYSVPQLAVIDVTNAVNLLCFLDDSSHAMGACVYIQQATAESVTCLLVLAKARIVPLKSSSTLLRLELKATILGARLLRVINLAIDSDVQGMYMWSDSQNNTTLVYHHKTLCRLCHTSTK